MNICLCICLCIYNLYIGSNTSISTQLHSVKAVLQHHYHGVEIRKEPRRAPSAQSRVNYDVIPDHLGHYIRFKCNYWMICNWISLNKQSNEENQTVLKKEAEGLCFGVCFFFFNRKILILTPHNFTLRWNSFSPSNTIWIFNLTGKTTENFVRLIKTFDTWYILLKCTWH